MRSAWVLLAIALTQNLSGCGSKAKKAADAAAAGQDPVAAGPEGNADPAPPAPVAPITTEETGGKTTVTEPGFIVGAKATRGSVKGQVTASWRSIAGAAEYQAFLGTTEKCASDVKGNATKASSTSFANVEEGVYFLCVRALDNQGKLLARLDDGVRVVADWTPPGDFAVSAPSSLVPSRTPSIEWTIPTGDPVSYRVRIGRTDSTCADFIVKVADIKNPPFVSPELPEEGDYTLCVDAMDESGNVSVAKSTFTVVPPKPIVTFVGLTTGAYLPINSISSFHVVGTCTEAFRNVTIGGTVSATASCLANHFFSVDLDYHAEADGNLTLTASQTDEVGTASDLLSITLVKDTVAPAATIIGAPSGVVQSTSFSVTIGGAGVVEYRAYHGNGNLNCGDFDLGALTPIATAFTGTVTASGTHTICAVGMDAAGNEQTTATKVTWTVNQKPTLTFTSPSSAANWIFGYTQTITFSAADAEDPVAIDFYYGNSLASCNDGSLTGYTVTPNGQNKEKTDTTFTWKPAAVGSYYLCAKLDDHQSGLTFKASPLLTVNPNVAPTLTFTNLDAGAHKIVYKGNYSIQYTATDADDDANVALYVRKGSDVGCTDGSLNPLYWSSIVTTRKFSAGGAYDWSTAGKDYGDYYVCAKLSDGTNANVFEVSAGFVRIDRRATFSFTSPTAGGVTIDHGASFTFSWTQFEDDDASLGLYLSTTPTATCRKDKTIAGNLTINPALSGSSYTFDTDDLPLSAANQSYYVCAEINDGINPIVTKWSRGRLAIKGPPPTITVTSPATALVVGGDTTPTVGFTAANNGSTNASITFYSKTTDTNNCEDESLTGWSNFASLPMALTGTAPLNYRTTYGVALNICGCITDTGSGQRVCSLAAGSIKFNAPPTIGFTTSASEVLKGQTFDSTVTPADPDNTGTTTVDIYLASSCTGTPLLAAKPASDGTFTFTFDSSTSPMGSVRLCAKISDGVNAPVTRILPAVMVYDTTCVWNGSVSTAWSNASNWTDCRGVAPTASDYVDIASGPTNQPTTDATTIAVSAFRGTGGGTITLRPGDNFRLGVSSSTSLGTVRSSVAFQATNTSCSTCTIQPLSPVIVDSGATLTLGQGTKMSANVALRIGSSTTAGHLVAVGGGSSSTYPIVNLPTTTVRGPSSGARSSMTVDGFKTDSAIIFSGHTNIIQFDRLETQYTNSSLMTSTSVDLGTCSDMVFTDSNWTGWLLTGVYGVELGRTVANVDATGCSPSSVTIGGSGQAYGAAAEFDSPGAVAWSSGSSFNCVWTGNSSTAWNNSGNWTSCNSRLGFPDQNDNASIPSGPMNQPIVSNIMSVASINGTGGGEVTVAAGGHLYITGAVSSNLSVKGATSTCATCKLHSQTVRNDATLTILGGVTVDSNAVFSVGQGGTAGHLRLIGGSPSSQATWPVFTPSTSWSGILVEGVNAGERSSIEISGATIGSGTNTAAALSFSDYYEIKSLDNLAINTQVRDGYSLILLDNCSNSDLSAAMTWNYLSFSQGMNFQAPGTHNVSMQNCSTLDPGSVHITPLGSGGASYGDFFADDSTGILDWQ